ncbi:metallophosphoesterase family protein [Pelagibius sp. Alg239-R121]|uniref:metallophosphoesterase family protein n=1 Tax=Pelagibius sp. Alg239-R121 TaxID=2993448 RepID=UPI0024A71D95|nr:metallophosphoesterase family protein [Pelagibius sp. Alg239-R121]
MRGSFSSLKRLFSGTAASSQGGYRVPEGQRIYAIGDVHGRADLLAELHEQIRDDFATGTESPAATVVYLGDYVDRGTQSRDVIDFLLDQPLEGFTSVHLKGNHEEAMLRFMDEPAIGPQWFGFGGESTVMSYGVVLARTPDDPRYYSDISTELRERVPARHKAFLSSLDLQYLVGDYLFVHAGIRPGCPIDEQDDDDLLWIRSEFLNSQEDHGVMVVHGHTPTARPDVRRNRIGIDTGAFASGTLTCLVLEGSGRRFLSTSLKR